MKQTDHQIHVVTRQSIFLDQPTPKTRKMTSTFVLICFLAYHLLTFPSFSHKGIVDTSCVESPHLSGPILFKISFRCPDFSTVDNSMNSFITQKEQRVAASNYTNFLLFGLLHITGKTVARSRLSLFGARSSPIKYHIPLKKGCNVRFIDKLLPPLAHVAVMK
mmetsp:Transcript_15319/g.36737  ORF Transcript_15319/g.36737 Transcript_15319/m.36737 type:complete len:163 (+) Transcript_15319:85-573(+)